MNIVMWSLAYAALAFVISILGHATTRGCRKSGWRCPFTYKMTAAWLVLGAVLGWLLS